MASATSAPSKQISCWFSVFASVLSYQCTSLFCVLSSLIGPRKVFTFGFFSFFFYCWNCKSSHAWSRVCYCLWQFTTSLPLETSCVCVRGALGGAGLSLCALDFLSVLWSDASSLPSQTCYSPPTFPITQHFLKSFISLLTVTKPFSVSPAPHVWMCANAGVECLPRGRASYHGI